MSSWSMVADEDTVDFCKISKNLEVSKSHEVVNCSDSTLLEFEKKFKELISLFRRLLESFLVEFCSSDSFRPLPPMTGDGRPIDLFILYLNVSHRGGFKSVSENKSWDEVAHESGLGFDNSVSAKLIYFKYLDALARWLNRVIASGADANSLELSGVSDDLVGRLKDFILEVKRNYELKKDESAMELGEELKWFVSETKREYDKYQTGKETQGLKTTDKRLEKLMTLDSDNKECSSPRKRKRECLLETLKWLSKAAKDPYDPDIGYVPDRSKWESYGSEEPWKQLLLFRASRTNTDLACEKNWLKLQKMHPSLYEDSTGPGYNLRKRLGFGGSQINEKQAEKGKTSPENNSASESSDEDRPHSSLVGPEFQAEVPEWTTITSNSDSKWLGTQVWPLSKEQKNTNLLIERDPMGKGRQDSCGCQNPGSIECVRFHISAKQEKLKLEIGSAFFMWRFDIMGDGTLRYWTTLELKKVKSLMSYPPTLSLRFFNDLKKSLSSKSRGDIVSYFYNVTILQFRANQNRITPDEVDSDPDIPEEEEDTSQKPVMLSPKKRRRRYR